MAKRTVEADVLRECLQYLETADAVRAWRNNTTGIFDPRRQVFRTFSGMKGVSDILGIVPPIGRLFAVECKKPETDTPGGRLSEDQVEFLELVADCGGVAICVDGVSRLIDAVELLENDPCHEFPWSIWVGPWEPNAPKRRK